MGADLNEAEQQGVIFPGYRIHQSHGLHKIQTFLTHTMINLFEVCIFSYAGLLCAYNDYLRFIVELYDIIQCKIRSYRI